MTTRQRLGTFGALILATVGTTATAFLVSIHVAETTFFDKLFYQKSIAYGYSGYYEALVPSVRTQDMYQFGLLKNDSFAFPDDAHVKGTVDDGSYKVAVVGDSFAWGQGVKEEDRLSVVLENKLNKTRKTKVFSLGLPAESLVDAVAKIEAISKSEQIDLFVIPAVQNDALIIAEGRYNRYNSPAAQQIIDDCLAKFPDQEPLSYPNWLEVAPAEMEAVSSKLDADSVASWDAQPNKCIAESSVQHIREMTHDKTLFVITDDYTPDQSQFGPYKSILSALGVPFVRSIELKDTPEFQKYWQNPEQSFQVSPKEVHPSAVAYQMYAAVVDHELLQNPRWKFNTK